jgi:hypothetical protein
MLRGAVAIAALALAAHGGGAAALELAGVRVPEAAGVAGHSLALNGAGVRTRLLFKVYVASLYVPHKVTSVDAVLASPTRRVRLDLLRHLRAEQLVGALQDGLTDNNPPDALAAIRPEVDALEQVMRSLGDVPERSVITLDYADGATVIAQDGVPRGSIPGDAFNQALLRIWLGDHPVQANLRQAMLGE